MNTQDTTYDLFIIYNNVSMLHKTYHIVFYLNHLLHNLQNIAHSLAIKFSLVNGLHLKLVLNDSGILGDKKRADREIVKRGKL